MSGEYGAQKTGELTMGRKLLNINWLLVLTIIAIGAIGIAILYSVAGGRFDPWADRQAVRFTFGLGMMFLMALIHVKYWLRAAIPFYVISLVLLALVPLIGLEFGGARRWLGTSSFSFQPAELMKVTLVLAIAAYYQWLPEKQVSNPLALFGPAAILGLPIALVLNQPDLGTALLLGAVGAGMMFLAGLSWFYYFAGGAAVGLIAPYIWAGLHDYQKQRVMVFLNPETDLLGSGYHIMQSKIALGAGGLNGRGFLRGTQNQLNFLPEKHTDFIFGTFAEEMGFIGSVILMGLFLAMLLMLSYMAMRCRNRFGRLLVSGMALVFFVYIFINMAMVMGLVPVVGVPLPLVSYGGTSLLTLMFGLGLAMSAFVHRNDRAGKG